MTPWNVDTLSKPGFEKTVINSYKKSNDELTEDEKGEKMVGLGINGSCSFFGRFVISQVGWYEYTNMHVHRSA